MYDHSGSYLWGGPSAPLQRIAHQVFTSGKIIYWPSPCGVNCTYTITFDGPAFQCTESVAPELQNLDVYTTDAGMGIPPDTVPPSDGIRITRSTSPCLNETCPPICTNCTLHRATYVSRIQYTDNIPDIETNVTLEDPILSSIYSDGFRYQTIGHPIPDKVLTYINFYAIEQVVEQLLVGNLTLDNFSGAIFGNSSLGLWNFIDFGDTKTSVIRYPDDFPRAVEELLINTTLSLIYFLQKNFTIDNSLGQTIPPVIYSPANATIISYSAQYSYSARILWESYGACLIVSTLCVLFGSFMLFRNGIDADMSFSQILVTTRNSSLDQLCQGSCLGGKTISGQLRETKLVYGELADAPVRGVQKHACFGLEDEVTHLQTGAIYM